MKERRPKAIRTVNKKLNSVIAFFISRITSFAASTNYETILPHDTLNY